MRLRTVGYPQTDPFRIFESTVEIEDPNDFKQGDVLILWGGQDIATSLYHQQPNRYTTQELPSKRDIDEINFILAATRLDIPIIGICRGAQLLTVMTGGTLIQHVADHGRSHEILCHTTGKTIRVNSAHHQVCQPVAPAEIIASSEKPVQAYDENSEPFILTDIPEIIHFPQIRALGVQFHPEWQDCSREAVAFVTDCIVEYLINDTVKEEAA